MQSPRPAGTSQNTTQFKHALMPLWLLTKLQTQRYDYNAIMLM